MVDIEKMTRKYFVGNPYIDSLSNREVFRFHHLMKQRGYQPATMRHLMNFIRQSIELAKKLGYQTPNIEYPKISVKPTRLRYLTVDEENRLINSLNPYRSIRSQLPYDQRKPEFNYSQHQYHDFVIMLLDTGARFSEISTLEWGSVDLQSKTIRLWRPKVRNESILYMTDRVYEVLSRRFDQRISNFIFTNSKGGAMKYISRMWERIFRRAGLDNVSAHTLRHTHASRLIQSGLSIYEVKEVLGHTDIHTTMRYSHLERVDAMKKAKDVMNSLNHRTNDHGTLATR
jgi:integrase